MHMHQLPICLSHQQNWWAIWTLIVLNNFSLQHFFDQLLSFFFLITEISIRLDTCWFSCFLKLYLVVMTPGKGQSIWFIEHYFEFIQNSLYGKFNCCSYWIHSDLHKLQLDSSTLNQGNLTQTMFLFHTLSGVLQALQCKCLSSYSEIHTQFNKVPLNCPQTP